MDSRQDLLLRPMTSAREMKLYLEGKVKVLGIFKIRKETSLNFLKLKINI